MSQRPKMERPSLTFSAERRDCDGAAGREWTGGCWSVSVFADFGRSISEARYGGLAILGSLALNLL